MSLFDFLKSKKESQNQIQELFGASIPQIEKTLSKTKAEIKALLLKVQAEISKKDKEDNSAIEQALNLMPFSKDFKRRTEAAEVEYNKALNYYNSNNYEKAFEFFSKSIEHYPSANTYYSRGVVAMDLEDYIRGIYDSTAAIVLDKTIANAYHNRALCFLEVLNQYDLIHDETCSTLLNYARENLKIAINLGNRDSEQYLQKTYDSNQNVVCPFHIIEFADFKQIMSSKATFKIWEQQVSSKVDKDVPFATILQQTRPTHFTGKYHFLFQANVSEKSVGLSENSSRTYYVPWELVREESFDGKDYIVFSGWGDPMNGGYSQFENYEIGVDKTYVKSIMLQLIREIPERYSVERVKKIIGLERLIL